MMITDPIATHLPEQDPEIRLFVSYAHTDAAWMRRLLPLLKVRRFVQGLKSWHDQELHAGDLWDAEIRTHLQQAQIVLCLVSIDFLASDYIQSVEMPIALERHTKGDAVIVPLILYPLDLQHDCPSLAKINPIPAWGKCWSEYNPYQNALKLIGNGLKSAADLVGRRVQNTNDS